MGDPPNQAAIVNRNSQRQAHSKAPPRRDKCDAAWPGMPPAAKHQYCVGSAGFEPSAVAGDDALQTQIDKLLKNDDLLGANRVLFKLPNGDDYIYHANASVSLAQVQHIVQLGGINGLHDWYKLTDGTPVSLPLLILQITSGSR